MTIIPDPGLRQEASPVQVSLMQGDVYCSAEPKILTTVLGSCVAVCLWDRTLGIGGMNHFVLPSDVRRERNSRYGDVAIDELRAGLLALGSKSGDLQAKVFGGAAVLAATSDDSVGSSNVRLALARLLYHHIRVVAQRTGGVLGQQIKFNTRTGEVLLRYITTRHYDAAAADLATRAT